MCQAAGSADFSLPEGFLYSGGNPGQVRAHIAAELESGDDQRISTALDMVLMSLSVNLYGTKLSTEGGSHRKFGKQGSGTQTFVVVVANLVTVHRGKMPPGATLNSLGSALPEIGILAMLSDASKPAPGVAQICFREEVKEGLMAKTTSLIGSGNREAEARTPDRSFSLPQQGAFT